MEYHPTEFGEERLQVSQVSHQRQTANSNSKLIIARKILGCFGESITDQDSEVWNEKYCGNYVVPYQFDLNSFGSDSNSSIKTRFIDAVDTFNGYRLPIRFREIIFEEKSYLNIKYDSNVDTFSTVGKQLFPTENCIMIGKEHDIGDILHEMMHVIGFEHEHQRPDRMLYIRIRAPEFLSGGDSEASSLDPEVQPILGIPITPYDTNSIMHYTSCRGSQIISGPNTPTNKPSRLSEFDKIGVYIMYGTNNWCTRSLFGDRAYPQPHYTCPCMLLSYNEKSPETNLKICVKCANTCHVSHRQALSDVQFEWKNLIIGSIEGARVSLPQNTQNDTIVCACYCTRGHIFIPMDM